MPFFNIFRNLFGGNAPNETKRDGSDNHHSHRHNFRNPIWQNGDDDDDDDDIGDFRHSAHVVISDPIEIMRHFESQMDQILKSFVFNFPQSEGFINIIPFEPHSQKKDNNVRDQMLKPNCEQPYDSVVPYDHDKNKVDIDLDGKVNEESLLEIWDKYKKSPSSSSSPPTTFSIEPSVPQFHSIQKSVKVEVVRRSDGTVEHKKIIRDSEGNEETIISRQIGDKKHVMSVKKDKDGMETKTDDLINMDEQELKSFDQQWEPTIRSDMGSKQSILDFLPWKQFFEPNPKL